MMTTSSDYKSHAKRLRDALAAEGIAVSHGKALDLVARQQGARDWNTLSAQAKSDASPANETESGPSFSLGQTVEGTFKDRPARGRVIGLSETIKPDLWRVTVHFDPPVNASTSTNFVVERRRVEMVIGSDGRSRRLTGTETGVMALHRA